MSNDLNFFELLAHGELFERRVKGLDQCQASPGNNEARDAPTLFDNQRSHVTTPKAVPQAQKQPTAAQK
jgi:hypothetical protein